MIQKEHLNWLTNTPASDGNFKIHLKEANAETVLRAWEIVRRMDLQITKTKILDAAFRKKAKAENFVKEGCMKELSDNPNMTCMCSKCRKERGEI